MCSAANVKPMCRVTFESLSPREAHKAKFRKGNLCDLCKLYHIAQTPEIERKYRQYKRIKDHQAKKLKEQHDNLPPQTALEELGEL